MLSPVQFERIRALALSLAGIELADRHRDPLARRARRAGVEDAAALDGLVSRAEVGEPEATEEVLHLLTTRFTGFFRHPRHFAAAAGHALDVARRAGRALLWCAATATGEEAYSLAISLVEKFEGDDPPVKILATDIDVRALVAARRGAYTELALRPVSPQQRDRFFHKLGGAQAWTVCPELRRLVEFRPHNLAGENLPAAGPFDVVFCRNVLMYMESERRRAVLERIAPRLGQGGMLILDPTEHLGQAAGWFDSGAEGVYFRSGDSCRPGRPHGNLRESRL